MLSTKHKLLFIIYVLRFTHWKGAKNKFRSQAGLRTHFCAHSFDFRYVNNSCVNTVHPHFPWSILYKAGIFPAAAHPWPVHVWHQIMKPFTAKCCERATLRRLWLQTRNTLLLPTVVLLHCCTCWPLLHVIRACSWRWPDVVAGISARISKFAFICIIYGRFDPFALLNSKSNLNVSFEFVCGNIEILGKQNSLFPSGLVIKW